MFSSPSLKDDRNLRSDRLRDTMSTSCCSLKSNKILNEISVWIKGSLRLSRSTPKRPHCTMTNADDLLFQRQEDPKSDYSLGQGFVALVVLTTKEGYNAQLTSRQSIHIVGPVPSVLAHETYRSSNRQAHPNHT